MPNLRLTLAVGDYDRTRPLLDGRIRPEGIDLVGLGLPVEEIFWRMARYEEFDASELSLSSYLLARARGDERFSALPVFPSRYFRHSCVFVHAASGIQEPADLRGKRVGVPEYQMTAPLWIRGFLADDYDVQPRDVSWYQGGLEQPGRIEKLKIALPPDVRVEPIPADRTLSQMLAAGEIDALLTARAPSTFDGQRVRRLFPDARAVERDYYRRTGIFPIMHTVVVRRPVLAQAPWVAQSLYKAFVEAKAIALDQLGKTAALTVSLPWLIQEYEQTRALMGEDYWPYGLEPNRATLEAATRYSYEQGLSVRQLSPDELFAPSTLSEYKV